MSLVKRILQHTSPARPIAGTQAQSKRRHLFIDDVGFDDDEIPSRGATQRNLTCRPNVMQLRRDAASQANLEGVCRRAPRSAGQIGICRAGLEEGCLPGECLVDEVIQVKRSCYVDG